MKIQIEILSKPSNSKGWARYAAQQNGTRIIESRTGNQWVGADHEGDAATGDILLTSQVMLREGKYNKETVYTREHKLVADEAATCEIEHKPGSQGLRLRITGARLGDA